MQFQDFVIIASDMTNAHSIMVMKTGNFRFVVIEVSFG